ncbi:MAG TPA: PQQ-dependent sugar dehydrogenase [Candidatus Dormibacteraeota bacterium]|nr:PQQ-dependent sugar dehydrogenase [Candidatus Dormibacteraeota bacterium]
MGITRRTISLVLANFAYVAFFFAQGATAQQVFDSERLRFQAEIVVTGLKQPSAMAFLPDGRALIVERQKGIDLLDLKSGKLIALEGGPEPLIGTETGVHDANRPAALTGEDAGYHDIVLHPDYARNGGIYVSYSEGSREHSTTAVDRYRLRGNQLVDRRRIFTADAYSEDRFHYGGRMAFLATFWRKNGISSGPRGVPDRSGRCPSVR